MSTALDNLARLRPAEVDARLFNALGPAQTTEASLIAARRDLRRYERAGRAPGYLTKRIADLEARLEEQMAVARPYEDEYARRPWVRYLVVEGGHLHKRGCHTLTPGRTMVGLVPEASGLADSEVVGKFGEGACTHCFSDAPVSRPRTLAEQGLCEHSGQYVPEGRLPAGWHRFAVAPSVRCDCGYRGAVTASGKYRKHKAGGS